LGLAQAERLLVGLNTLRIIGIEPELALKERKPLATMWRSN
jgi:hypothetical protein